MSRAPKLTAWQAWFDPQVTENGGGGHHHHYDVFRRGDGSSPTISAPSTASSGATPAQPYYPAFSIDPFPSMGLAPSPPPSVPYGMAPGSAAFAPFASQHVTSMPQRPTQWRGMIPTPDDDVIPTAIVIKNIPFAVSRETLLAIIESLGAPLPYAFNYHHDNGVFRGLAFANFRAPEEAASVVAALNGYDVQGRKLRVEYKKVLQPGEKDRIEREKAIKRMKSMQLDSVKTPIEPSHSHNNAHNNSHGHQHNNMQRNGHHQQVSYGDSSNDDRSPTQSSGSNKSDTLPVSLDLNDPSTLSIYNMVYMFKEDRMRDELVLSRNLSPTERRIVHLVAQKLALTSVTKGDADSKHVVVTKDSPKSTQSTTHTSYLQPYPEGNGHGLRIKKSMPDLRGFNGPVVARDPARSLTPQRSSGNLRETAVAGVVGGRDYSSMGASHGRRLLGSGTFNSFFGAPVGAPPVPPLPASLSDLHGDSGSQPLRNPRGPVGESRGFSSGTFPRVASSLRGVPGSLALPRDTLGRRLSEEDEQDSSRANAREELDI